jgi:N-acetylglucosamine-6-sulfatase
MAALLMRKGRGPALSRAAVSLLAVVIALDVAGRHARAAQEPARPNIVFLLSDDHKYDLFGLAGAPLVKTPNLDRLAQEGAWLRQAFVVTPLCAPSSTAFLTGLYGQTSGFRTNNGPWPVNFPPSFLKVAHDAGYRTAFIGKKHIYNTDEPLPGLDRWVSFVNQGLFVNPIMNIDGTRRRVEGANGDLLTDFAVDFIRQQRNQNPGQPFAMVVAFKEAHSQQTAPPRFNALFEADTVPLPSTFDEDKAGKPRYFTAMRILPDSGFDDSQVANRQPPEGVTREQLAVKKIKNYYRCVAALDDYVGRIRRALEETGQLDRTILVFAGDNGYFLGEHGRFEKMTPHEESVRVPFLVRYPAVVKPGTVSDAPALNIDLAPTLYDLASLPGPQGLDGRSLRSVLTAASAAAVPGWRRDVYLSWQGAQGAVPPDTPGTVGDLSKAAAPKAAAKKKAAAGGVYPPIPTWRAVRTPTHKYAVYLDGDVSELYDLRSDPRETRNLIADAAQRGLVEDLHRRLLQLADETHDPLRPLLPAEPMLR